jgi:fructose-1,6-bisphosphatase I
MKEILEAIQKIGVRIDSQIKRGETDKAQSFNTSGDQQVKLDILSDQIVEEELKKVSSIKEIISEEKSQPVEVNGKGEFLIAYDPLDGSSLVDVNLSVGSIFGIYRGDYKGENIVGAGYIVYGPRLELVWSGEDGKVILYRWDGEKFNRVEEVKLKEKGKILGPGGTQAKWYPFHKELIDSLFQEGYRLRYSGGMVPDIHQILLKGGGLFAYPATTDKPKGKLRRLFEVFPFALIVERAGGKASNGTRPLLELGYSSYHDTTPCFFGSSYEISRVEETYSIHFQ